jgi:hypothetical protein
MKLATFLAISLSTACLQIVFSSSARADEHEHERRGEERREMRHEEHPAPRPRPEPPRFQPHPPGIHPRGATFHPHAVRVMRPHIAKYGVHPWRHWTHPEFVRPVYYWDWAQIHQVTCIAEDSYGDQYPVTEEISREFGLDQMSMVEDDALDRCYEESRGDQSCFLATCSHF